MQKDFLLALIFLAICTGLIAFLSFSKALAMIVGIGFLALSFVRPDLVLLFLAVYFPFEPFLLKFVPNDVYVLARYFSEGLIYLLIVSLAWHMFAGRIQKRAPTLLVPFLLLIADGALSAFANHVPLEVAFLGMRQIVRFMLVFFIAYYFDFGSLFVRRLCIVLVALVGFESALAIAQAIVGSPLDAFLHPGGQRFFGTIQLTTGVSQFWEEGQRVFATMGRYDQLGTFLSFTGLGIVAFLYQLKGSLARDFLGRCCPVAILDQPSELAGIAGLGSARSDSPSGESDHPARSASDTPPEQHHPSTTCKGPVSQKLFLSCILLLVLSALLLTYSRASWFGFLIGLFVIGVVIKRDKKLMIGMAAAVCTVLGFLALSWFSISHLIDVPRQAISDRFFESFSYERWRGEYRGLGRLFFAVHTPLDVVARSPLIGFGPGTYGGGAAAALHYTKTYEASHIPFGIYGSEGYIDNNWFSVWGELGTLGLALYALMFIFLFRSALHVYRTSPDALMRTIALGYLGGLSAVTFQAFLATYLEVRTLAFYVWFFGGLIVAAHQYEKHHRQSGDVSRQFNTVRV